MTTNTVKNIITATIKNTFKPATLVHTAITAGAIKATNSDNAAVKALGQIVVACETLSMLDLIDRIKYDATTTDYKPLYDREPYETEEEEESEQD